MTKRVGVSINAQAIIGLDSTIFSLWFRVGSCQKIVKYQLSGIDSETVTPYFTGISFYGKIKEDCVKINKSSEPLKNYFHVSTNNLNFNKWDYSQKVIIESNKIFYNQLYTTLENYAVNLISAIKQYDKSIPISTISEQRFFANFQTRSKYSRLSEKQNEGFPNIIIKKYANHLKKGKSVVVTRRKSLSIHYEEERTKPIRYLPTAIDDIGQLLPSYSRISNPLELSFL